jgi:hypothetical protein
MTAYSDTKNQPGIHKSETVGADNKATVNRVKFIKIPGRLAVKG